MCIHALGSYKTPEEGWRRPSIEKTRTTARERDQSIKDKYREDENEDDGERKITVSKTSVERTRTTVRERSQYQRHNTDEQ